MRVLRFLKTAAICTAFLGLFLVTAATIVCCNLYPDEVPDHRLAGYLMKNIGIQSAAPDDYWANRYPFDTNAAQRYTDALNEWKERVESFCTVSFPEAERMNRYATLLKQRVYHYRLQEISDSHGNYLFVQNAAANVIAFAQQLGAEGIPLLYVHTPLLGTMQYYQGMPVEGTDLVYAERNEALCHLLEEGGIPLINVGKEETELFSYDASNHWYPANALTVARRVADRLNRDFGFSFHMADFEPDSYVDCLADAPQLREQILAECGYEYAFPVLIQQHQYKVIRAEKDEWTGPFFNAIARPFEQWNPTGLPYHGAFRINNKLMYEIANLTTATNPEKTILLIGDSYSWPICTYLTCGVGRVILINNSTFTGSMLSYVRAVAPDVVLMAFSDAQFFEESNLEKSFDLR